jgi:hypothetical protein
MVYPENYAASSFEIARPVEIAGVPRHAWLNANHGNFSLKK